VRHPGNQEASPFLWGQPLVPLLLLGPPFFPIILFGSTTLLTGMTDISLHMQWPLTSQSHGSVSQREQLVFLLRIKLHEEANPTDFEFTTTTPPLFENLLCFYCKKYRVSP
jgi:hypothetical protein